MAEPQLPAPGLLPPVFFQPPLYKGGGCAGAERSGAVQAAAAVLSAGCRARKGERVIAAGGEQYTFKKKKKS